MIKHLLNDTAVVKSVSSVNEYDEYTFSEPKNIKCNIEFKVRIFCFNLLEIVDIE